MVSSRCFFQYFSKIMFPCIFFFKNCISSISFPAQFQDVFPEFAIFPECFFQYWFFNVYFSRAVFCQFFPARDYKFFPVCFFPELVFSRCYIFFSSAVFCQVFPAPWFFQNVFSRIAVFFPEPSAYIFFQNVFSRIVFCQFYCAPCAHQFFSRMFFSRIAFCQFFSCAFCLPFFPGCFFPNCNFAIFFLRLVLISFFQNVFSRIVFCQFFPAPSNASFFRKVFSRIGVSLCSIFFQNCILPFFLRPLISSFFHYVFSQKDAPKIPDTKQSTKKTLKNPYQNISEEEVSTKEFPKRHLHQTNIGR